MTSTNPQLVLLKKPFVGLQTNKKIVLWLVRLNCDLLYMCIGISFEWLPEGQDERVSNVFVNEQDEKVKFVSQRHITCFRDYPCPESPSLRVFASSNG